MLPVSDIAPHLVMHICSHISGEERQFEFDILKTACCHLLHGAVCCVVVLNQIHKAGSHQMGEMADGSHHLVVVPCNPEQGE